MLSILHGSCNICFLRFVSKAKAQSHFLKEKYHIKIVINVEIPIFAVSRISIWKYLKQFDFGMH
jgi:hypothetical protein